jgi:hypothetical protein
VSDNAGGVKSDVMEAALHSGAEPDRGLHSGSVSGQQIPAVQLQAFGEREGCGQAGGGRVDDAGEVCVVKVEPMDQNAVGKGSIPDAEPLGAANHRAVAGAAKGRDASDGAVGVGVSVRGEADAKRIEDEKLRPRHDRLRNGVEGQIFRELRKRSRWTGIVREALCFFNARHRFLLY